MSDMDDQLLMSTIREFLCLYDKGCPDYKIPTKKENAWRAVSEKVGFPVEMCTTRYTSIRTQFSRYIKDIRPPSGAGRESISLKKEFEHLRWLICHIKHRDQTSNFKIEEDVEAEGESNKSLIIFNDSSADQTAAALVQSGKPISL